MLIAYFIGWIFCKCPEFYVNGNITSWGIILIAVLVIEGLVQIK